MKFITSFTLERSNDLSDAPWENNVELKALVNLKRLVVLVFTRDDTIPGVVVYGIDPAQVNPAPDQVNPEEDVLVYARGVATENLGALLRIVMDGPIAAAVAVPTQDPPPIGPKIAAVLFMRGRLRMGSSHKMGSSRKWMGR